MLNKVDVLKLLSSALDQQITVSENHLQRLASVWYTIAQDQELSRKIDGLRDIYHIPTWNENELINKYVTIAPQSYPYRVLSIDGSQIYPDRHHSINPFLINLGIVEISYTLPKSSITLQSTPYIFIGSDSNNYHSLDVEAVNCRRTELEIRTALEVSKAAQEKNFLEQQVSFIDGSLIFWHLENKEPSVKHRFLTSYLASLQQFYEYALVHCGYISSPKSRDLITLIQYAHHNTQFSLEHIIDSDLVSLFVPIQARTILFKSNSAITSHYPLHLQPFFYYLNTGSEVVRIELPAWIANNSLLVDMLSAITLDQIIKGSGYPVCLCEAHEQAVIKGADRDFFYHAFHQLTVSSTQHRYSYSQKLLKKRGIGI